MSRRGLSWALVTKAMALVFQAGAARADPPRPDAPADPPATVTPPEEVTVRGVSPGEALRKSAEAVDIVDTRRSRERALSVGDVLARTQGVGIRRAGGLGSETLLSLNGLSGSRVPIFIDGVPIDIAGYPQGIANVPISLVERVEIYRGVVPLRFGAEALGGAINLVTDPSYYQTGGSAALERGSFGLYRASGVGRYFDEGSGFTTQVTAYADRATNRYRVLAQVPDERGRNTVADVVRFHDAYAARGVTVEGGLVDRPFAKRLLLRLTYSSFEKELQHNIIQAIPYGEATVGESTYGALLRYDQPKLFGPAIGLESLLAVSRRVIDFRDVTPWVYDWSGQRVAMRARRGEVGTSPHDQLIGEPSLFGRAILSWTPSESHVLRIAANVRSSSRSGKDDAVLPGGFDAASSESRLTTLVAGAEQTSKFFDDRLENIAAVKGYAFDSSHEEVLVGSRRRRFDKDDLLIGYGDALRFQVAKTVAMKVSYEHAVRFPHPNELFGDGGLVRYNTDLRPEESDNVNIALDVKTGALGPARVTGGASGFARYVDNQIFLLSEGTGSFTYQNVLRSTTYGVEAHAQTSLFDGRLLVDGNVTYQDVRNGADTGPFARYQGDRIPHQPYLFANGGVAARLRDCFDAHDLVSFGGDVRYVNAFLLGWQSVGAAAFKLGVPDQLVTNLFLSYALGSRPRFTSTFEVQNVGDSRAYDFYGIQRPRRSASIKLTTDF